MSISRCVRRRFRALPLSAVTLGGMTVECKVPTAGGIVLKRRRGLGLLIQRPRLSAEGRGASPRERVKDSSHWCSVRNARL